MDNVDKKKSYSAAFSIFLNKYRSVNTCRHQDHLFVVLIGSAKAGFDQ